jgi:hypothetical protein
MRSVLILAAVAGLLLPTVAGCSMAASPVTGSIVVNKVQGPVLMGDNTAGHSKTGVAEAKSILGFAMGDASIKAAMDNGSITKVHHVDSETFSVLMVYATYKTIVYGD